MSISVGFSRLAIVPVIASVGIFGFADSASAITAPSYCKATTGVKSVVYKVDGKVVSDLRGNVRQGSLVSIDFKIASGCSNVPVNISAYQAPSPIWDPKVAYKQVLVGSVVGNFNADNLVHNLKLTAPNCYFQVDFGTGTPMTKITDTNNQATMGDLISADNGGTKVCSTTSTTVPQVTTTVPNTTTTVPQTTTTVPQTTTTVPQTTTTTVPLTTTTVPQVTSTTVNTTTTLPTTTTVVDETTTTVPEEVLAETIEPAVAQDAALATTGANSGVLIAWGGALMLAGIAVLTFARILKRRSI